MKTIRFFISVGSCVFLVLIVICMSACTKWAPMRVQIRDTQTKEMVEGVEVVVYRLTVLSPGRKRSDMERTNHRGEAVLLAPVATLIGMRLFPPGENMETFYFDHPEISENDRVIHPELESDRWLYPELFELRPSLFDIRITKVESCTQE